MPGKTGLLGAAAAVMMLLDGSAALAEFAVPSLYFECGAECRAVRDRLADADATELANVPAQVTETLAVIREAKTGSSNAQADIVAAKIARGTFDGVVDRVKVGTRSCTVYWYGFLDRHSERVGTHRCRVSRDGGKLVVEKLTGDGLRADVLPYAGTVRAFVGRTYLPDQPERAYARDKPANAGNSNYGNKVGLVLADKGRLYLIDIEERGFDEPDRSFFEAIVVD